MYNDLTYNRIPQLYRQIDEYNRLPNLELANKIDYCAMGRILEDDGAYNMVGLLNRQGLVGAKSTLNYKNDYVCEVGIFNNTPYMDFNSNFDFNKIKKIKAVINEFLHTSQAVFEDFVKKGVLKIESVKELFSKDFLQDSLDLLRTEKIEDIAKDFIDRKSAGFVKIKDAVSASINETVNILKESIKDYVPNIEQKIEKKIEKAIIKHRERKL